LAAGQRCEDGASAPGVLAEEDRAAGRADRGVDEQELADGAVAMQDGGAVPAGFGVSVCGLLVEQDLSGAVDEEPADQVARFLVGTAQKLLLA
jgi:hypothetical protein